jgi:hypothetical protein
MQIQPKQAIHQAQNAGKARRKQKSAAKQAADRVVLTSSCPESAAAADLAKTSRTAHTQNIKPGLKNLAAVGHDAGAVTTAQAVGAAGGAGLAQAVFSGLKTGFVKGYIDPQATLQQCRELAAKYPDLVDLVELPIHSHGYDGKREDIRGAAPLYYMRLGPKGSDRDSKLGVFQHASPHAREHINPMTMVELAEQLCANYDPSSTDPAVMANTRLMSNLDIYISPQPNPDGANYSLYDDKEWRKNRAPFDGVDTGVDVNRNYPYKWEKSSSPDYQTYAGKSAASEPETRALMAVVDQHPNIRFVVDWHSYSEEIRRPLGVSAQDKPLYDEFHNRVKDAIASSRGRQYGVVESEVVEGASDDYYYHERALFSSIIETARAFQPAEKEALQVAKECARGAREVLEFAADFADQKGLAYAHPPKPSA